MFNFQDRLVALQSRMVQNGIDMAAIGPTANMLYLLGFVPHPDERVCLLLVTKKNACMIAPAVNLEVIAAHINLELFSWGDSEGPALAIAKATSGSAIKRLAVDGSMRADFLLHLQNEVQPETTLTTNGLLTPLRLRKSADEIEKLAVAAANADLAMKAGIESCLPGVTEADVAWAVEAAFRQGGAESVDFTLIASGPNGAYPHHHSGDRRLQKGDAIILDIGATVKGYKSDITRVVHLGDPTAEFQRAYAAVLDANQKAMAAVRPGVQTQEIDRAARTTLEDAGLGKYFVHRTGHGLGLEGHEPPWIMEGDSTVLQEGMTFSIEPGVYLTGKFGVRIEDIVAVTPSGARNLTGFDHSLVVKT